MKTKKAERQVSGGEPDPSKLTCPTCGEPAGKRKAVVLHPCCCSYAGAHASRVKAHPIYARYRVKRQPDVLFTRGL